MTVWKAAFAALSLFVVVEAFMNPTVSSVSRPRFMTATLAEPTTTGATSSENIRNIAGE